MTPEKGGQMGKERSWETIEDAVRELTDRRDDIDSVQLRVKRGDWRVGMAPISGAFAEVRFCGGDAQLVNLDIAEALLNSGVLHSLRIAIHLVESD